MIVLAWGEIILQNWGLVLDVDVLSYFSIDYFIWYFIGYFIGYFILLAILFVILFYLFLAGLF